MNTEDTELENEEEVDGVGEEQDASKPSGESLNMQTFSRIIEDPEYDKLSHIEAIVDQISAKLGDEDDNRASYENMLQFFKSLKASSDELLFKLNHEIEYTRMLEEKQKRKTVEIDNLQLKKALLEEQGKMTIALENFQKKMDETLGAIKEAFDSMEKKITDNCTTMQQKADEIKSLKDEIDDIMVNYNKDLSKGATAEFTILKNDCRQVLDSCNTRVGDIKESVLSFLKTCSTQSQDLIKKIPEQRRKFSWLDVVVYALCGVCIVGMIVQMVG